MKSITPSELLERRKQEDITLIDVCSPAEYQAAHVEFAKSIPLQRLQPDEVSALGDREKPIYFICRTGSRGRNACAQFQQAGFSNVVNVEGGLLACEAAGLPIIRSGAGMSMERQVRIAAGGLVLLGLGLSFFNHFFLFLSAFVGAGLVFSGLTDSCGMAVILSRLPWNSKAKTPVCQIR